MSALAKTQKKKALDFVSQAESKMNAKSWFASSKLRNLEDGCELYMQAANAYKVGGMSQESGDVYVKIAALQRDNLENPAEAAKCFSQAGNMYKKTNATDAVSAFQSAIALLTDAGRLTQAAKLCKECAELYENEEVSVENASEKSSVVYAIEFYEQASELFGLEDSKSQSSNCLAKIAELCSASLDPPDLIRAAQIYDDLGTNCLDSNLLKFNAKGYFLQSILCHLANSDSVGAEDALAKYEGVDYSFSESREGKFAKNLVDCVNGMDAEQFATVCFEYDRISKLDPWKTSMLVKVKRCLQDNEFDVEGEDEVDLT